MTLPPALRSFLDKLRVSTQQDPARDWLALISLSLIALALIIVWNIWTFSTVASGGTLGAPAASTPGGFNRTALDTVHAVFSARAAEEDKYRTGAYRFADPSQ